MYQSSRDTDSTPESNHQTLPAAACSRELDEPRISSFSCLESGPTTFFKDIFHKNTTRLVNLYVTWIWKVLISCHFSQQAQCVMALSEIMHYFQRVMTNV